MKEGRNIFTVFAGRAGRMSLLKKYLEKSLSLGLIDEVHFWNNTRLDEDEIFLMRNSNVKRTSSIGAGEYIEVFTPIEKNSIEFDVKASNDIHIKISNRLSVYEVIIGAFNNAKLIVRKNGHGIHEIQLEKLANNGSFSNIKISVEGNHLNIFKDSILIASCCIEKNFQIQKTFVKTGHGSVGFFEYKAIGNEKFFMMDPCGKGWKSYYENYSDDQYEKDLIIKCDDDIVFIDLNKFKNFIDYSRDTDNDLVFANIINNGVSAHFQQKKGLIPREVIELEYPAGGFGGSLWASGEKAKKIHDYFLENHEKFTNSNIEEKIKIDTRFSVNFFSCKGKNWNKISKSWSGDDEHNLTAGGVRENGFKNVMYFDFFVSHLSFGPQENESGFHGEDFIEKYDSLFQKCFNN
jgi:hypothetical protein